MTERPFDSSKEVPDCLGKKKKKTEIKYKISEETALRWPNIHLLLLPSLFDTLVTATNFRPTNVPIATRKVCGAGGDEQTMAVVFFYFFFYY